MSSVVRFDYIYNATNNTNCKIFYNTSINKQLGL